MTGGLLLVAGLLGGLALPTDAAAEAQVGAAMGAEAPVSPVSGLRVMPFPGTPDAAATTTIILPSLRPSEIAGMAVTGSVSGHHAGHLRTLPHSAGTAFVPDSRFAPGEKVSVTARLTSPKAGTASGDPGATALRFSFGVARSPNAPAPAAAPASASAGGPPVFMHFHSQANFEPPGVQVSADPDPRSGDLFLTARHTRNTHTRFQGGPMILDSRGRLVWFHAVSGQTTNLEVQHYNGGPVLTWWQGNSGGAGEGAILDSSYRRIAFVHAGNGYYADSHEFQITPQGTALLDAVVATKANLTSVGGPANGTVQDCVLQEIDIKTGQVLWEWHALGHIPLSASYAPYRGGRYDYLHCNSIQQLPNHNLLLSARHTWAVYEINKHTGNLVWTLGGKDSNFRIGSGARFSWQHDAHLTGNTLTLFDDASNGPQPQEPQSSAKEMRLNIPGRTATLVRRFYHSPPIISSSQGSAQLLSNGNMFVGWGDQPEFSESRSGGHQIFSGSLPPGAQSYRAYRFHWDGQPTTKPSLGLSPQSDGSVKVYASWNGATRVASWRVLGGSSPGNLSDLGGRKRTGFETESHPHSEPAYFAVQAMGPGGTVLATSHPHPDPPHVAIFAPNSFVRASEGTGAIGVGCFTRQACHVSLRVSSGKTVLARVAHPVARGTGALLYFKLSAAGIGRLAHATNHRLPVTISVHDSVSGSGATRNITLIPYSIAGAGPGHSASQSPTVQLLQRPGFVSSGNGEGQLLAACYASRPCQVTATISANGKRVAHTAPEHLGVNEIGVLYFKMSADGRSMLRHASGNQLPAQITLSDGADTATGNLALVSYR
jgi:Arylsulfotransferase (ASST)